MKIVDDTVSQEILSLISDDREFQELSNALDVYCPFEALGVARMEIRHSNFLADILAPTSSHGFGDIFAKVLLDIVFSGIGDHETRLDLHLEDITDCEILREWNGIDILLTTSLREREIVLAIEVKVEASEHGKQLEKYEAAVRKNWPDSDTKFIYLTPRGVDPSSDVWTPMSFSELIDALAKANQTTLGSPKAHGMVDSYIDMMRRRYLSNERLEKISRSLWNRHTQALEYLVSQKPDMLGDLSDHFSGDSGFKKLSEEVFNLTGLNIAKDHSSRTFLRFAPIEWDEYPQICAASDTQMKRLLSVEAEFYDECVFARIFLSPGDPIARQQIHEVLSADKKVNRGRNKNLSPKWTRLVSKRIVKTTNEKGEMELETAIKKAHAGLVSFLNTHLPIYTNALKQLENKRE